MGLKCHSGCIHKRNVPGDAHISCVNPDPNVKGDPHGIRNGWFFYPLVFDPIWGDNCSNYQTKKD